jgi:hypothetical protein
VRGKEKKANSYTIKLVFPLEKLHPVDIPAGQNDLGIEEGQFEKEANGLIDEFTGMAKMGCAGRVIDLFRKVANQVTVAWDAVTTLTGGTPIPAGSTVISSAVPARPEPVPWQRMDH